MKNSWNKLLSLLAVVILIVSSILPGTTVHAETEPLANGEYTIEFEFHKDGTDDKSVMDGYTEKPAKLSVEDDNKYVELTLTNSSWILELQTEHNGAFSDVEVISEDKDADKRIVRFPVEDLSSKVNAKTHVVVPAINYDNHYDVQIAFDETSLVPVNIEQPEPEQPGEGDEEQPTDPETPGDTETTPIELEDGVYTTDFDALHATEDKASSMNRYFSPNGTLTVKDGKTFFSLEIIEQPGQDITEVLLENNGALQAGTLLSEENLKRVEEFEIDGSSNIIPAQVSYYVAAANHTGTQPFRISINLDTVTKVEEPEQPTPEDPENPEEPVTEEPNEEEPPVEEPNDDESTAYTIDFEVHKDGTEEVSVMDGYTVKPAKLIRDESGQYIELTLTNNDWILLFQTEQNGEFVDAEVVHEDTEADTRTVRFPIENLSEKLNAYTHVVVPDINYDNYYTVQFAFDEDSLELIDEENQDPITDPGSDNNNPEDDDNQDPNSNENDNDDNQDTNKDDKEENGLNYDRNNDDNGNSKTENAGTNTLTKNAKTGDTTNIGLLLALLGASVFVLFRKYRLGSL